MNPNAKRKRDAQSHHTDNDHVSSSSKPDPAIHVRVREAFLIADQPARAFAVEARDPGVNVGVGDGRLRGGLISWRAAVGLDGGGTGDVTGDEDLWVDRWVGFEQVCYEVVPLYIRTQRAKNTSESRVLYT